MIVQGGRVIDPANGIDALLDVRIAGGVITELGEHLRPGDGEEIVDARNAFVAPGFVDMHVHLREPGQTHKETIATGTAAAVLGGFTAVACMPNTTPALDSPDVLAQLEALIATDAVCRVFPVAAMTRGRKGRETLDYPALEAAGAVAFSDDGNTVMDARVMRDAALAAREVRGVFISHCEDESIKADAVMHEGEASRLLGVAGSPAVAEDIIVARDLLIAEETKKRWHIAHVSTKGALDLMRWARARGIAATCEVTPHHLLLTDEELHALGSRAKVNPPLRSADHASALRAAVRDGTIDAFATDHAPHTEEEKSADLRCGAVGFSGLEIAVGAYAAALPGLPLERYVALLSTNPSRILGIQAGTLGCGAAADVTIFADRPWRVDPSQFASLGKSTPLAGRTLPRRAIATIVGGRLVMHDGRTVRAKEAAR